MGTVEVMCLTFIVGMALSCIIAIPFIAKVPVGRCFNCLTHSANKHRDGNLKVLFRNTCYECNKQYDYNWYNHSYCCQVSLRFKSFHELEGYIIKRIWNDCKVMSEPYVGMGKHRTDGITFRINNANNPNQQSAYEMEILRIENEKGCLFNRSYSGRGRNHCSKKVEKWIKNFEERLNDIKKLMSLYTT